MILIETKYAYFNNLKIIFKVNHKHNFYSIINTISLFYNHENLKKTFSKFTYIINTENSTFLINYYQIWMMKNY